MYAKAFRISFMSSVKFSDPESVQFLFFLISGSLSSRKRGKLGKAFCDKNGPYISSTFLDIKKDVKATEG